MKKLIRNIILFSIPLIALMFIADWFLSNALRSSRQGEFSVWNDIYDGNINAEVVVYGSSRAMVHFDPKIISDSLQVRSYNLGINGHNFWLQYFRHKELLEHNRKPKLIIHSVDIFTLVKRKDLFQMEQFLPYLLYNNKIEEWTKDYQGYDAFDYRIPLIRYYGQFKTIGKALRGVIGNEVTDSLRYKGFVYRDEEWNDDLKRAKEKYPDFKAVIDTASVELFDQYIRECLNNGIALVFVYSPEYIEGHDFVKNRDEVIGLFSMFSDKYNIPFLDYSVDPISHQKEYFYNASHLNGKGAQLFTSKLVYDMRHNESLTRLIQTVNRKDIHQASLNTDSNVMLNHKVDNDCQNEKSY